MKKKEFWQKQLISMLIASGGGILLLWSLSILHQYTLCLILFILFSVLMPIIYTMALRFVSDSDIHVFTQFSMLASVSKLAITALLIILFFHKNDGLSLNLVWPYLFIYIVFTIFETYMMMKISNLRKP